MYAAKIKIEKDQQIIAEEHQRKAVESTLAA